MMKALVICGLLAVSVFAGELETQPFEADKTQSREVNYKKFLGETQYPLPFLTKISEPVKDGQTVHMLGKVNGNPKRININFQKGNVQNADLPLHISARWDEGIFSGNLVYNTRENSYWAQNEQRISNPFTTNGEFDLRIRLVSGKYQIYGNRAYIGSFDQKALLSEVDHVSVHGDLENLRLFHYGGQVFPNPYTAIARLVAGKRLDIAAVPTGNRVDVTLYRKNRKAALHLSIRFKEGAIVRNSMLNDTWGVEEREGGLPITNDQVFDLTLVNEPHGFQIFLNGNRYASYAHRSEPTDIEALEISGNVDVQSVTINDADAV